VTLELRKPGQIEHRLPARERARTYLVGRRVATVAVSRRWAWTGWQVTRQAVPALLQLAFVYSWRGVGRSCAAWARYLRDDATAELRTYHAGQRETKDMKTVSDERRAERSERRLRSFTAMAFTGAPILAWTSPAWCGALVGVLVFVRTLALIPGRKLDEVAAGLVAGAFAGVAAWWFAPHLPIPPAWVFWAAGTLVLLGLGWVGRPREKPLVSVDYGDEARPHKPTADEVIQSLCRIGLPGMTPQKFDEVRAETRVLAPGVATSKHGYVVELELPPGRTASEVVGAREQLAGALRRDLGCVWPAGREDKHPGWLRLFLSHQPMNSGRQPAWPLAAGKPVDIFEPMPLFTDEEMRWVDLTIAGTHTVVGGASGFGKSVWLRQLTCAIALDPRVKLVIIDGKRSNDFEHVRKLAHGYYVGAEPDEVEEQLDALRALIAECLARAKFLGNLPVDERSPKVTSELASKYPQLRPIVLVYDEVQEGTEYGVKGQKTDKAIRDQYTGLLTRLARIARSAGVFMVLASQKPDSGVLPSSIMGNCSIRVAFKVSEQVHNDQILGTSARRLGIDATMFGARDRGMAWLKGGDAAAAQVVRSWSEMVDPTVAVELADKAYAIRQRLGMLTGQADEIEEAEVVLDFAGDVRRAMAERGTPTAHLAELVDWLREMRPDYERLTVKESGQRARSAGLWVGQVWRNDRTATGVDLRKQAA
jgi:S-DNA-T family DNA segregation ATPase FtsK/SpoIIIE